MPTTGSDGGLLIVVGAALIALGLIVSLVLALAKKDEVTR